MSQKYIDVDPDLIIEIKKIMKDQFDNNREDNAYINFLHFVMKDKIELSLRQKIKLEIFEKKLLKSKSPFSSWLTFIKDNEIETVAYNSIKYNEIEKIIHLIKNGYTFVETICKPIYLLSPIYIVKEDNNVNETCVDDIKSFI